VKLELELTQSEYDDLTLVAEQRLEEPEKTGHDLLVAAVGDELDKTGARPTASQRWGPGVPPCDGRSRDPPHVVGRERN
jgi:hypothetical protein